jgi:hypothetical protein
VGDNILFFESGEPVSSSPPSLTLFRSAFIVADQARCYPPQSLLMYRWTGYNVYKFIDVVN